MQKVFGFKKGNKVAIDFRIARKGKRHREHFGQGWEATTPCMYQKSDLGLFWHFVVRS
jgi:hypothetical protein